MRFLAKVIVIYLSEKTELNNMNNNSTSKLADFWQVDI